MNEERAHDELDALLGDPAERARARARLAADPEGLDRLASLARALGEAGEALRASAAPHPSRQARFVARVLSRTTRQDLSWRGDLRLLTDFLQARLAASPALRFVAALLALQLVAAPAVALLMALRREPKTPISLHIELPRDEPFDAPLETPPRASDELVDAARLRESRENARARERWTLGNAGSVGTGAPRVALPMDAPLELTLLDARAALLATRSAAEAPVLGPDAVQALAPLALTLWTDLALDRRVLLEEEDPALGPAALRLAEQARSSALGPGTAALARASVARAVALGVLDGTLAPGADGTPGLLDAAWFDALARAADEHGLARSAVVDAWRAWGIRLASDG